MKTCNSCGTKKPPSDFGADPRKKDGLRSGCKKCRKKEHDKEKQGNIHFALELHKPWCGTKLGKKYKAEVVFDKKDETINCSNCLRRLEAQDKRENPPTHKTCAWCDRFHPISHFLKDKGLYRSECRDCKKLSRVDYIKQNGDKIKAAAKHWYRNNKDYVKKYQNKKAEYIKEYNNSPEAIFNRKENRLAKAFLLTYDEFSTLFNFHNGKCWICNKENTNSKSLAVEHCHTTNQIRGICCMNCNAGLGTIKDSPEHIKLLISYLKSNTSLRVKTLLMGYKNSPVLGPLLKIDRDAEKALKQKYGLSFFEHQKLVSFNDNRCWACNNILSTKGPSALATDHCHRTKKIRGILCFRCNTTIGRFFESIPIMTSAINYLIGRTPQILVDLNKERESRTSKDFLNFILKKRKDKTKTTNSI